LGGDQLDDMSPRFNREDGNKRDDDDASISLTQYYLKGSTKERKAAKTEQEEFIKTLN